MSKSGLNVVSFILSIKVCLQRKLFLKSHTGVVSERINQSTPKESLELKLYDLDKDPTTSQSTKLLVNGEVHSTGYTV